MSYYICEFQYAPGKVQLSLSAGLFVNEEQSSLLCTDERDAATTLLKLITEHSNECSACPDEIARAQAILASQ